jgi:hypothetical protein
MSLSQHFNSKSQMKRRVQAETETFGKTLSRYFAALAGRKPQQEQVVIVKTVAAPVRIIRRGMNI